MNKTLQVLKYLISDILSAALAWTLFFIYRKVRVESIRFGYDVPLYFDLNFFLALSILPFFWLLLYYFSGYYNHIYRKSRLHELGQTFFMTVVGVIIIFFVLILDDFVNSYVHYYNLLLAFFVLHFFLTYIPRVVITTRTNHKIRNV